ncbi:short chain dehydrogenase [Bacillus sp. M6-12]|uniref:SDR family NAD(P)-dependent oxidoreductase n=1 Tax=Bacillus sp. M6-12 TaxID=2054166 RepID=UPI000C78752F|nr:SDR family NAD(P)-dependent oxidoreductase [Bacillus sp. M6-12]PLS15964.1 short chain dehydrogenase [Bacillus sp. M6-12]
MKKALVLGATGSMGSAIVHELVQRGVEVSVFARNKERLNELFQNLEVNVVAGDGFIQKDLDQAASGVEIIFNAVNIPYQDWQEKLRDLNGNILNAAKKSKARLAIVDNIYGYGRSKGVPVSEKDEKKPHTKKGKIRVDLERRAKESGVEMFIAHFPDFYGPNAGNTLLNYTLTAMAEGKTARFIGDKKIEREYIYTPDGAKALVELALRDQAYGQNWNIPGAGTISGEEIIDIAMGYTKYRKKVSAVSKNMIRFIGFFDKFMREYLEMYYLTEEPVVLNGSKYEREIGLIPRTSYEEGIRKTLASISAIS